MKKQENTPNNTYNYKYGKLPSRPSSDDNGNRGRRSFSLIAFLFMMISICMMLLILTIAYHCQWHKPKHWHEHQGNWKESVVGWWRDLTTNSKQSRLIPTKTQPSLSVHIVPHSHQDVGWIKSAEEYYEQQVRHIYHNVIAAMALDPQRTFIVVEQAFFSRWFDQDASVSFKV